MAKKEYEKRDYHQELTDKVIERIESAQKLNWEKPWYTVPRRLPFNLETGTRYSGCNLIATAMSGFDDPRWLTFNGIRSYGEKNELELKIRKGERGTPIFKAFFKELTEDKDGKALETPRKLIYMTYAGTVFNAQQIEGMPAFSKEQTRELNPMFAGEQLLEALIARTNLKFFESSKGAYYSPSTHTVAMPAKNNFKSDNGYYDTLFHEFGHSTGPALGRKMEGTRGGQDYAYEELIAELSSCFMASELGIEHDQYGHDQNAAYIKSWLTALKNDKNFIFKASNAASKATNYQMDQLREYLYNHILENKASKEQKVLSEHLGEPQRLVKERTELSNYKIQAKNQGQSHSERLPPTCGKWTMSTDSSSSNPPPIKAKTLELGMQ